MEKTKNKYIITKAPRPNMIFLFPEDEFAVFDDAMLRLPTTIDKNARSFQFHIYRDAAEIEMDEISEVLERIKEIPVLWKYLTEDKEVDEIHKVRMNRLSESEQHSKELSIMSFLDSDPYIVYWES